MIKVITLFRDGYVEQLKINERDQKRIRRRCINESLNNPVQPLILFYIQMIEGEKTACLIVQNKDKYLQIKYSLISFLLLH